MLFLDIEDYKKKKEWSEMKKYFLRGGGGGGEHNNKYNKWSCTFLKNRQESYYYVTIWLDIISSAHHLLKIRQEAPKKLMESPQLQYIINVRQEDITKKYQESSNRSCDANKKFILRSCQDLRVMNV